MLVLSHIFNVAYGVIGAMIIPHAIRVVIKDSINLYMDPSPHTNMDTCTYDDFNSDVCIDTNDNNIDTTTTTTTATKLKFNNYYSIKEYNDKSQINLIHEEEQKKQLKDNKKREKKLERIANRHKKIIQRHKMRSEAKRTKQLKKNNVHKKYMRTRQNARHTKRYHKQ